ncbi:MAG: acyltransferase [Treponema sp.]|jgi:acetyltransferase-like isoleucine patch superfamily enzyme|nr:acyltransferase [Treponema sp.]
MNNLLYKLIRKLLFKLIAKKKKEYDRFLSVPDYIIDRWERAKMMGFGEGSSVYDSCLVLGNVSVGKNTWIGPYTVLDGSGGGLIIGDNCQIGPGVKIYSHDTTKKVIDSNAKTEKSSIIINNNVAIGSNTVVSMGVHIGECVIIAPNSWVVKDIPPYSKAFGSPARVSEKIEKI